ncbi:MAG: hypothetical protein WA213_20795 [Terriglobales bacterium]
MATFPPAVSGTPPQQGASPQQGGASPAIKLVMLGQMIKGLAQEFPGGQEGIQMMLQGLQKIQASASAASTPPPQPAPPR